MVHATKQLLSKSPKGKPQKNGPERRQYNTRRRIELSINRQILHKFRLCDCDDGLKALRIISEARRNAFYSNCSKTISGWVPTRMGGPQVPAPLEV